MTRAKQKKAKPDDFRRFQVVQIVNAKYPENEGIYGYVTSLGRVVHEDFDERVYEVTAFRDGEAIKFLVEPKRLRAAL